MKNFLLSVVLLCSALIAACGGGGGGGAAISSASPSAQASLPTALGYPSEPSSCSIADQRSWLNAYMADQYFWNANLAVPNAAATSQDEYFNSLLFAPTDRYSFTQDAAQASQFVTQGTRTGYGYATAFTDATQTTLRVRSVEPAGPAAAAGLMRGDTVLAIDGLSPARIAEGELRGVSSSGVTRTFSLLDASGTPRILTMVSSNFAVAPNVSSTVFIAANGAKVGYLAYQEFTAASLSALGTAFNRFRTDGVTELIVDLRYNAGGSVLVARALASLIGGASLDGEVFAKIRFNAQNEARNFDFPFTSNAASLPAAPLEGLTRVFFITSPNTASASELVINSLAPFRKVITIGAATFGKPFGFQPRGACSTVYNAVNFETFNARDFGRYTAGLPATCNVSDDLSKALGDLTDLRTAAALSYIQNDRCPAASAALQANRVTGQSKQAQASAEFSAPTRWMEPGFGEVATPSMVAD